MMRTVAAASLAIAAVNAEAAPGSAVTKVIQLLGELKSKVAAELDTEKSQMAEYSQWCDDTITQAGFDIKTATSKIEELAATIEEMTGEISEKKALISETGASLAADEQDLAAATKVREGENSEFVAAEKELVEAVDMLARAHTVLSREMKDVSLAMLQGGKNGKAVAAEKNQDVVNAVRALSAIVNAAWMDPKAAKKVNSFLERAESDDDDLSLVQQKSAQPAQAAKYSYEGHSDAILDTIMDMKDKAEDQLSSLRKAEMNSKHNFEMLKQSLEDQMSVSNKQLAAAKKALGEAGEAKGEAEGAKAETEAAKASDETLKATTTSACEAKSNEWEERQKSATEEMAALDKAKEILSSGVKAMFFQSTAVTTKAISHIKNDSRSQLVRMLKKMGRQYNSFGLMQIANAAGSDPFVKVRGLIETMISKLEKEAQEEATQEAYCQEETAKSNAKRDELTARSDTLTARVDKTTATIATLKSEIANLEGDIAALHKTQAEADKMRAEENAAYTKASTDFKESAEAVAKAITVLREFYGSAALLQMQQAPEFSSSKSDSGNSIIAFLETAENDFTRLLAEEETAEEEASAAYKKLTQETKVSVASKAASVKGKTSEVKSLEVALGDTKNDLSGTQKELDAVLDYSAKLKEQCTSKAMSYEERKARREAEMAGLKEALNILSGEAPALVQTSKVGFMARK